MTLVWGPWQRHVHTFFVISVNMLCPRRVESEAVLVKAPGGDASVGAY